MMHYSKQKTPIKNVRAAVRPLLRRNSDLVFAGHRIVVKPVEHVLRSIEVRGTYERGIYNPSWQFSFLFIPRKGYSSGWAEPVDKRMMSSWSDDDPLTPSSMSKAIEDVALPALRPLRMIEESARFANDDRFRFNKLNEFEELRIYVDIARGDFDAVGDLCSYFAQREADDLYSYYDMDEEHDWIVNRLCPLVAKRDRPGIANLLHEIELQNVTRLNLEHLWQPTPFPIELQA